MMSNRLEGVARRGSAIREVYAPIFSETARVQVCLHDYTLHEASDTFYVVGHEKGTLIAGEQTLPLAIRTTRLFRRIDEWWQQVHHLDPFENSSLLAAYREAVR